MTANVEREMLPKAALPPRLYGTNERDRLIKTIKGDSTHPRTKRGSLSMAGRRALS